MIKIVPSESGHWLISIGMEIKNNLVDIGKCMVIRCKHRFISCKYNFAMILYKVKYNKN